MKNINNFIEHTLLKSTATTSDIISLCNEGIRYNFYGVCINSCYVNLASYVLKKHPQKVIATIGFPLGASSMEAKIEEAEQAIDAGADEIDMVINLGFLKSNSVDYVSKEIRAVKKVIGSHQLKVIIETCYLNNTEIRLACELSQLAGADFVKTSTGFGKKGALLKDVRLIKKNLNENVNIKASGGIKTFKQAIAFINAGSTRIGTSNGVSIVNDLKNQYL